MSPKLHFRVLNFEILKGSPQYRESTTQVDFDSPRSKNAGDVEVDLIIQQFQTELTEETPLRLAKKKKKKKSNEE